MYFWCCAWIKLLSISISDYFTFQVPILLLKNTRWQSSFALILFWRIRDDEFPHRYKKVCYLLCISQEGSKMHCKRIYLCSTSLAWMRLLIWVFLFLVLSVNAHTPALHVNGSLLVPFDGFAPLLPTLLQVKDPDSPSEQLIFQLVQKPSNGRLVLFRGEEGEETGGREIKKDYTFTWAELRHGRVRFQYQRDKDRSVRWTKLFLYFAWNYFSQTWVWHNTWTYSVTELLYLYLFNNNLWIFGWQALLCQGVQFCNSIHVQQKSYLT